MPSSPVAERGQKGYLRQLNPSKLLPQQREKSSLSPKADSPQTHPSSPTPSNQKTDPVPKKHCNTAHAPAPSTSTWYTTTAPIATTGDDAASARGLLSGRPAHGPPAARRPAHRPATARRSAHGSATARWPAHGPPAARRPAHGPLSRRPSWARAARSDWLDTILPPLVLVLVLVLWHVPVWGSRLGRGCEVPAPSSPG